MFNKVRWVSVKAHTCRHTQKEKKNRHNLKRDSYLALYALSNCPPKICPNPKNQTSNPKILHVTKKLDLFRGFCPNISSISVQCIVLICSHIFMVGGSLLLHRENIFGRLRLCHTWNIHIHRLGQLWSWVSDVLTSKWYLIYDTQS